jgi:hypothetical protein
MFELLPEIWAQIRFHLQNPWDARPRVALQRVCKWTHRADPGLILAPVWAALLAQARAHYHLRTSLNQQLDVLTMMEAVFREGVPDLPCVGVPLHGLISAFRNQRKDALRHWTIRLVFFHGDRCRMGLYVTHEDNQIFWKFKIAVFQDAIGAIVFRESTKTYPTLGGLLSNVPVLARGYDPRLLIYWAEKDCLDHVFRD